MTDPLNHLRTGSGRLLAAVLLAALLVIIAPVVVRVVFG